VIAVSNLVGVDGISVETLVNARVAFFLIPNIGWELYKKQVGGLLRNICIAAAK